MKIVVATRYFYNDGKGYGADLRILHLYSRIKAEVSIVVQGKGLSTKEETFDGLKVVRSWCLYPFHFLTRLPSLGRFLTLFREARKADAIVAEFHPFHAVGIEAWIVAKLVKKPLILDVHDIALGWLGRIYEKWMYKRADLVIATSRAQGRYISEINPNVVVVPNGCEEYEGRLAHSREEYDVGFIGALTKDNGVYLLAEVAKANLRVRAIGDGPLAEYLSRRGVEVTGYMERRKALKEMAKARVAVAPFPEGRAYETNLPLKLPEYMMLGKPVVASGGGEMRRIIEECECGVFVKHSPAALVAGIKKLLSLTEEERKEMGKRGRAYALKHFLWSNLAKRFEEAIKGVVK